MKFLTLIITFVFAMVAFSQDKVDTKIFPAPQDGYKQVVLDLKGKKHEDILKLEIIIGKNAKVDKCNQHFLIGELKSRNLEGYGYTFYQFSSDGAIAGTKMGCMDNELVEKFITGQPKITEYNSKIPVVIYVPNDMEVKFRFWKTKAKWTSVKE